jgi:hypothetical protein
MADGFVKEPAVATRQNFRSEDYKDRPLDLERLKLEDGVRIHEDTKAELKVHSDQHDRPFVKPFMLIITQDVAHAERIVATIKQDDFFSGDYKDKVITVHSTLSGEEKEETVAELLSVESPDNKTEIVVHVNMLKEGWDVTNLFTIVPLRKADSRTLVEQSIGRGLRLPYGQRTRVPAVDRLTIVAHDKFQEIIDEANKPGSSIHFKMAQVIVGRDIVVERKVTKNVLLYNLPMWVELIHAQMQKHRWTKAAGYDVSASRGFESLKDVPFTAIDKQAARDLREPPEPLHDIPKMLFAGFARCLYPIQKFGSDPERRFAILLEDEKKDLKWFKPARVQFCIYYRGDQTYAQGKGPCPGMATASGHPSSFTRRYWFGLR